MDYVTSFERAGIQKGIEQGIEKGFQLGESAILERQLVHKFKHLPEGYRKQISSATKETLLIWAERILESQSIEEVFKE